MKQESFKFSGRASNPATRKFSPAQIAAQKLFAERARAGTLKQRKRRKPNPGLYENIDAKRKRIAAGSGEKMRKPGQAGRPTAEAFEQSAMTAKRNPAKNLEMKIQGTETPSNPDGLIVTEAGALRFAKKNMPADMKKAGWTASVFPGARGWAINYSTQVGRKTNPDKDKPNVYIKRVSQATGAPPTKRLVKRRTKALFAPAGYFPNPKAAMMPVYQVVCMHPKKHVVGIFKTMAEAKQIATAMANANNVPYAIKTHMVQKAHFAA